MTIGLLFWIVFVIWVIFGAYRRYNPNAPVLANDIIVAVLLFLLGWGVFGFVVRNDGAPSGGSVIIHDSPRVR